MSLLRVRNLTKSYGGRAPALREVTLEIGPGVTGLLGPNGAGKSTLIQCVLGLFPDYEGEVTLFGLDARRDRDALRRRVGFMPEADTYLPEMTGIQAVRFLGQLSGLPRQHALRRAHEVLFHVGLGEAIYRRVEEYSTGMRQRFKLAQALVHDPEIVFLDEPLSGLDPDAREDLLGLIRTLADGHGKHVVWSSHILPDVQKVAAQVVVLHQGRYCGRHALADLAHAGGRYDVEAEGDADGFARAAAAAGLEVHPGDPAPDETLAADRRTRFTLLNADGDTRPIFAAAARAGVRLRRVAPRSETLEEVFLRILDHGGPDAGAPEGP